MGEKENTKVWIASFDIGKKNFAFLIEETDMKLYEGIKNIPLKNRYNEDGTTSPEMERLLSDVYSNGKTILHINSDLRGTTDLKNKVSADVYTNMYNLLNKYSKYWDRCDTVIIEEQMAFGKGKTSIPNIKMGQHCYSYFVFKYGGKKTVIEFPAYNKTQILGCRKEPGKRMRNGNLRWKAVSKPKRKKWSIEKATEILLSRGEIDVYEKLDSVSKKDDLADTLTQLQAYKYLAFIDGAL